MKTVNSVRSYKTTLMKNSSITQSRRITLMRALIQFSNFS